MALSVESLSHLSRHQLYSMVNQLRREVQCLATNVKRYEMFAKKYTKYLNELQNISEIRDEFDEDLDHLRQQLVALSDMTDYEVVVDNQTNRKTNTDKDMNQ